MKKIPRLLTFVLAFLTFGLPLAAEDASPKSVNAAAAARSLERAASFLAAGDWADASFEAQLGETFDPGLADFPYIEALSLAAQKAPRADILERVRTAVGAGLFWRSYTKNDALVLCARLEAQTRDYSGALKTLSALGDYSGPDADFVKILSYYGLSRTAEARALVAKSLEKWPFDSQFPRVTLLREASLKPDSQSLKNVSTILSRLYVWENDDRSLLLLAVPFEPDPAVRERNIRTFRNMGKRDPGEGSGFDRELSSALPALEYGILDEDSAVSEVLPDDTATAARSDLVNLCRLVGKAPARERIKKTLDSFNGILSDDSNGDGIVDAWIRYRLGRPSHADFDVNQDGYPDFSVSCDLGRPSEITLEKGETVTYDTYPDVRSVVAGKREYTLKPLALKWAPVEWVRENLKLDGLEFYSIRPTGKEPTLTEKLLVSVSAFYVERESGENSPETRVTLEGGVPVSSETREKGRVTGTMTYVRGYPASSANDRDGDGYFETRSLYTKTGKLLSVMVDRNADRAVEYREDYGENGSVTQRWDSDQNGSFEISRVTSADGTVKTTWIHPVSGLPVSVVVEKGAPRSVTYASATWPVIEDPFESLWWIRRIPAGSRELAKKIVAAFNPGDPSVVSVTINQNGKRICAVQTGGMIFAELLDE